jgi:hypothetical protein
VQRLKQEPTSSGTLEEKAEAARTRAGLLNDLARRVTQSMDDARSKPHTESATLTTTDTSTNKGKERDDSALESAIPSVDDLLDVTIPHCSPYSAQPVREAGFALLTAVLTLPKATDSLGLVRTSNLFKLCLADPSASTLIQTQPGASWNSSPALEIVYRVGCLERLTKYGEDLSFGLECGLVAKLVQWIKAAGKDWVTWCSQPDLFRTGADDLSDMEHTLSPTSPGAEYSDRFDPKKSRGGRMSWDAAVASAGLSLTGIRFGSEHTDSLGITTGDVVRSAAGFPNTLCKTTADETLFPVQSCRAGSAAGTGACCFNNTGCCVPVAGRQPQNPFRIPVDHPQAQPALLLGR